MRHRGQGLHMFLGRTGASYTRAVGFRCEMCPHQLTFRCCLFAPYILFGLIMTLVMYLTKLTIMYTTNVLLLLTSSNCWYDISDDRILLFITTATFCGSAVHDEHTLLTVSCPHTTQWMVAKYWPIVPELLVFGRSAGYPDYVMTVWLECLLKVCVLLEYFV